MRSAIDEYAADARRRGLRDGTIATLEYRLHALHDGFVALDDLTPARCATAYERRCAKVKPDTHRNELQVARAFAEWCRRRGWMRRNPWDEVEAVGGRARGKEQLRIDEARRFSATCMRVAQDDPSAVAALCALLLGLRAHEIVQRVVRDVDDRGRVLWITSSKTAAGRRRVAVPPELGKLLLGLVRRRDLDAPVWPGATNDWLRYHVARLCRLACVPEVCPHSLRGLHATLAIAAGETSHAVSAALGHTSAAVTRAHYTRSEATDGDRAERAARVLADAGNRSPGSRSRTAKTDPACQIPESEILN